jgi:tetratricopeptide (TPR) repeat protein
MGCIGLSAALWTEPHPRYSEAISKWSGGDSLDVADGSYWSIPVRVLLHPTLEHLILNLVGIVVLGVAIERSFGRVTELALVLSGTLLTTAGELAFRGRFGVGASGVLYTFYGFVLMASARRRVLPLWLLLLVSSWLLYGAIFDVAEALDHQFSDRPLGLTGVHAHLAGLAWGALCALAFVISWKPRATRPIAALTMILALVPLRGTPWVEGWLESRADRAFRAGKIAGALDLYTQAISRSSKPASARVGRGDVLLSDGRLDDALADFDAALRDDAKVSNAHALRSVALALRSDLKAALDEANREIDEIRASGYAYATRAGHHLSVCEFEAAIADLDSAINLEPREAANWVDRGIARAEQCQYESALADIEQGRWLEPGAWAPFLARGQIQRELSRRSDARSDLEKALSALGDKLQLQPRNIWILCFAAETQRELYELDSAPDRLNIASKLIDQGLALAPDYWYAWQVRGRIEFKKKNSAAALHDLSRAVDLNPRDGWSPYLRGLSLHELDRLDDALTDLNRALELNPKSAIFHHGRAVVRHTRGDDRLALDDLNRALELNPRFAEAWQLRGTVQLALGEDDTSRADLRRAVDLEPALSQELDQPHAVR